MNVIHAVPLALSKWLSIWIKVDKGPFKCYVSKEVGGWGWPNADVSKK